MGDDVPLKWISIAGRGGPPIRGRGVRRIALGATLVVALVRAPETSAQVPSDDAETLIRRGVELRVQGQDAQALPYFEGAYRLARTPRTAAQLGLVKMALGYCVDADRLLGEALAVPDHPWIEQNHLKLEKTRANARKNIGEIAVTGLPIGAEVVLNGRGVGHLPLPAPLRLDKGPVELQVRAPAYATFSRSFKIAGGEHENVAVALVPSGATASPPLLPPATTNAEPGPAAIMPMPAASSATAPPQTSASVSPPLDASAVGRDVGPEGSPSRAGWMKTAAWTCAGGAAAALALGILETVVATNRTNDFNAHTSLSPTPEDPNRRVLDCETSQLSEPCRSIRDARDRARTLAIVGYVGAGVVGAASAALFMLGTREATANGQVARAQRMPGLACGPTPLTPGVSCSLIF